MSGRPQNLPGATLAVAFFLVAFAAFAAVTTTLPMLHDNDSYYHLGVARIYLERGFHTDFPWTRLSAWREGFGDKELLFHALLLPAAAAKDPNAAGKVAVALFAAAATTAVALSCVGLVGRWGYLVPLWLLATSTHFTVRLLSLRPESLSLLLLLAAAAAAGRRRYRLLGAIAFLYTLSYTAFQALLGLAGLWFLHEALVRRRREWGLLLYPAAGTALALIAHPQFPANLRIWYFQNVLYFRFKDTLDVGREIMAPSAKALLYNVGWIAGLAALWRSGEPAGVPAAADRQRDVLLIAAVCFGALALRMERFAIYAVPFITLALLAELRRRGLTPGPRVRLPGGVRLPLPIAFGLLLFAGIPAAGRVAATLEQTAVFVPGRADDLAAFGRAVPAGARIAAPWGETALYLYSAPQGRYLNVLDPVFMAAKHPGPYWSQRAIFDGVETDVPLALARDLDSEYLAFSPLYLGRDVIYRRCVSDPRLQRVYGRHNFLFRVAPAETGRFLLDWEARPAASGADAAGPGAGGGWKPYRRETQPRLAALEGFVDVGRVAGSGACAEFRRQGSLAAPTEISWEFAPSGAGALWLDGRPLAAVAGGGRAILGEGLGRTVRLGAGTHTLLVRSCPEGGRGGFYLLERGRAALPETARAARFDNAPASR